MKLTIPGTIYDDCLDPLATSVPKEAGWPTPKLRRKGLGKQAIYETDEITARCIIQHIANRADDMAYGVDPEMSRMARTMRRWATNAIEALKERDTDFGEPTVAKRWLVKCDDCKATIRETDDVRESYAGGQCFNCRHPQPWRR